MGLGLATWLLGDAERGAELERQALRTKRDIGDQVGTPLCLDALAWIAASCGQPARAASLLGAADTAWQAIPAVLPQPLAQHRTAAMAQATSALGEASFAARLTKAYGTALSRSVAAALGEPARAIKATPSAERSRLTPREREVVVLITQGLSNHQIAATMTISARTAETHIQHIMVKLGFTTRAQIAAWSAGEAAASQAEEAALNDGLSR